MTRPRWPVLAYTAAWLPYLTVYGVVFSSAGLPGGLALRAAAANVVPEALLGLLVPALVARLAESDPPRRLLLVHAAAGVTFAATATAGKLGLITLDRLASGRSGPGVETSVIAWQAFVSLLVYVALAGVAHATAGAERARQAAEHAARADALRARAELAALRAQLDPHFLLNALHSVLGLVGRDPARAESALERLGDLLRYSLRVHRNGVDEVALEEEWEFVRSYLELEALRLGDRLRSELDAAEGVLACVVPTFALQVLVENAVRHAVAPRAAGGRIRVEARRAGGTLVLVVEDDGPGPGSAPRHVEGPPDHGVGLSLLAQRLGALYGDAALLETGARPGGGFRAVVRLPCAGARPGDDQEA